MTNEHKSPFNLWLQSRTSYVLVAFLAIVIFFLVTEHTAHFFGVIPYLLFLACPLLHHLMHKGNGKHADHNNHKDEKALGD